MRRLISDGISFILTIVEVVVWERIRIWQVRYYHIYSLLNYLSKLPNRRKGGKKPLFIAHASIHMKRSDTAIWILVDTTILWKLARPFFAEILHTWIAFSELSSSPDRIKKKKSIFLPLSKRVSMWPSKRDQPGHHSLSRLINFWQWLYNFNYSIKKGSFAIFLSFCLPYIVFNSPIPTETSKHPWQIMVESEERKEIFVLFFFPTFSLF